MSGTSTMAEKMLQVYEICQIIKACADYGVTSLKCGPLELSFGKQTEKIPQEQPAVTEITEDQLKELDTIENDAHEEEEVRFRREQIDQMMIENPSKAEELLASGELVDDDADADTEE